MSTIRCCGGCSVTYLFVKSMLFALKLAVNTLPPAIGDHAGKGRFNGIYICGLSPEFFFLYDLFAHFSVAIEKGNLLILFNGFAALVYGQIGLGKYTHRRNRLTRNGMAFRRTHREDI